jgi:hypothetical protein
VAETAVNVVGAIDAQIARQVAHWTLAASRLRLDDLASSEAWGRMESYLGISVRRHLQGVVDRLAADARALQAMQEAARDQAGLADVHRHLLAFEQRYLRAETTLDFFADAINVRTNTEIAGLLRACDTLAQRSMAALLDAIGQPTPVALTYLDKGRGASILKAGLRLWDGGEACPVAVIKVTRHNLLRPTALVHEAGHQVAHIAGWNAELAAVLADGLLHEGGSAVELSQAWAGWASEIAADCFAFGHTGYASVAALHDVLAAEAPLAFRSINGDPHPVSYLRVLLGVQLCRHVWGDGPWDELAVAWRALHPIALASNEVRDLVHGSLPLLPLVARLCLDRPMHSFAGRSLRAVLPPERVSPAALREMQSRLGPALFTSAHWLWSEPLRILGLTGLELAQRPREFQPILEQQRQSMLRLGGALQAT